MLIYSANIIFSRMIIALYSDAWNPIFISTSREKIIFAFWQKGNFMFVGKRNTIFTEYRKDIIFPCIFWEKTSFTFQLEKIYFLRKRNAIFSDDTGILQCDFFGKTIFSEDLKRISYFHVFFFVEDHLSFSV